MVYNDIVQHQVIINALIMYIKLVGSSLLELDDKTNYVLKCTLMKSAEKAVKGTWYALQKGLHTVLSASGKTCHVLLNALSSHHFPKLLLISRPREGKRWLLSLYGLRHNF